MAAASRKSGPTRHWKLGFTCRALPSIGVAAAGGWMAVSLVFLGSSWFSNAGAALPAAISSPLFAHLFLFGMLGFLTAAGAQVIRRSERLAVAMAAALLLGGAWALATEWYQSTLSGRDSSLEDLLANVLGAATGALLAWLARRRIAQMSCFLCAGRRQENPLENLDER